MTFYGCVRRHLRQSNTKWKGHGELSFTCSCQPAQSCCGCLECLQSLSFALVNRLLCLQLSLCQSQYAHQPFIVSRKKCAHKQTDASQGRLFFF